MDIHDLTAAYALDALDADETEAYEKHLSECAECRAELAELREAAMSLAYGPIAPVPPPRLRASILETAAAERSNVVPLLRRRWIARGAALAAAAAACVAVGLGVALTEPGAQQTSGIGYVLAITGGKAMLSTSGLAAAPSGKTYEAWIIPSGEHPRPAGLFRGGSDSSLALSGAVPRNAVVAVTLEPAGGSAQPTSTPIFSTRA